MTLEWTQTGSCPGPSSPQSSIPAAAITSTAILQHDPMGRIWQEQVCPLGTCSTPYQFNYTYDFAGNVTSSNNGLPASTSSTTAPAISWGETYDAANHLSLVSVTSQPWSDSVHPPVLFQANQNTYSTFGSAMPYDPFGHLVNEQLSLTTSSEPSTSGISVQRQYNNMGRILDEVDYGTSLSNSATGSLGSIFVSGSEQSKQGAGTPATPGTATIYVGSGTYSGGSLTVNGSINNAGFSCTNPSSMYTPPMVASAIANCISSMSAYATASSGGQYVYVTARTGGAATNCSLSVSISMYFSLSYPSSLSGGANATQGGTVYDSGTITATINGKAATVSWGQGSTPSGIASALQSAINTADSSFLTATVSGTVVSLTSNGTEWREEKMGRFTGTLFLRVAIRRMAISPLSTTR
ncbi:MAG: hypothetical protein ABSG62_22340 [Terracidiphilus sp.]